MKSIVLSIILLVMTPVIGLSQNIAEHLQNVSVTVLTNQGSGSGVIITRDIKLSKDKEAVKVNFVLTAGHVVDGLRSVRTIVDLKTGQEKKVVEFKPVFIAQDLVEDGRKVGELKFEGKVIKYSDAEEGEDLAVILLHKRDLVKETTEFYLEGDMMVDIGTQLFHVGSLLGQGGSNSMTTGIMSQVGRVLPLGSGQGVVFDQTTVTAFPGSSGGGVFLAEGNKNPKLVGVLVRGAGETFNLIVPVRRIHAWANKNDLEWILDSSKESPTLEDIEKISVE